MKTRFLTLASVLVLALVCSCHRHVPQGEAQAEGDGTASYSCTETPAFDDYFTGERLRVDLTLAGNSKEQRAYVNRMYREKEWSGSAASLIDQSGFGQYFYEVFSGSKLVYSKGFSTLFEEWRSTAQASSTDMSMGQSIWMPFPKDSVSVVLYQREHKSGKFVQMLKFGVDPADRHIEPAASDWRTTCLHYSGESQSKVDLVFVGEGYTNDQMSKLRSDARGFMSYLFSMAPYDGRSEDFNIWLVESASADSGVDIPQDSIWRRTILNSGYDTFYEDRYLTVLDHTKIADAVSDVPFDTIVVIANDEKYGGGGIYNSFALNSSDHHYSNEVFIHEFGHSFAGLGDEYFDSSNPYSEDYYPADVEPWEPNITTKVNFSSKWEDMMDVPGVGLYEGAGYMTKGCWRPFDDCRMRTNTAEAFCPVCQRAINKMIDYYTK